jgi:ABC-2 type transport system ATP-binding protein
MSPAPPRAPAIERRVARAPFAAYDPRVPSRTVPPAAGDRRVSVRGLTRRFGPKLAVAPLDLDVGPGGITGLLGPNGSGKSTLLRMIVGIVPPDAGSASVDGVALAGDGTAVRRRCTYTPGEIALYGEMRGREHLDWLLRGRERDARERAARTADALGLPLEKRVHAYSHGMKRQLLFAAAMAPQVGVRILDEASEGLDPSKRSVVLELMREDAAAGATILLSSHHLGEVERACERFVFLDAGRIVGIESAASLAERSRRIVRIAFDDAASAGAAHAHWSERARRGDLVARAEISDAALTLELAGADPRPFLAELARRDGAAPRSIEYGATSLQDLYRGLYGVEAC